MTGRSCSFARLALLAWVGMAGCGRSAIFTGEVAQIDDGVDPGDGDGDGDGDNGPPPRQDGGAPVPMDSGMPEPVPSDAGGSDDAGLDGGLDAAIDRDADVTEDAGEPDAAIIDPDPLMCWPISIQPHIQLGTPAEPYEHALSGGPLEGEVDARGRAFIRITGVTPGESYAVVLAGDRLDLAVFEEEDWLGDHACMSRTMLSGDSAVCTVTASSSTLGVTVNAQYGIKHFELMIFPASEPVGTRDAPQPLALSELPRELSIAPNTLSFYEITGLEPDTTYIVKGTSASPSFRIAVFNNGYMSPAELQYTQDGAIGQPTGTSLPIAVFGPSPDAPLTLDVTPATGETEGTPDAPLMLDIGELPYEGQTSWAYNNDAVAPPGVSESASYYAITGLTPGVEYAVSLEARRGVQLNVYYAEPITADAQPQCSTYVMQTEVLRCGALATGSTLYVKVVSYAGDGPSFTLAVEPSPYVTEGTELAPIELTRPDFPYGGEVLATETSHYRVSGLAADQLYLMRISDQTTHATRLVVVDELTSLTLCELAAVGGPIQCTLKPEGRSVVVHVTLSLENDPLRPLGGTFTLDLDELDERPTSSLEEPIPLDCSEGIARSILSASGMSYYRVDGLAPDHAYFVEAHATEALLLEVSAERADGSRDNVQCISSGDPMTPASCLASAPHGSLIIQVSGNGLGEPIDVVVRRALGGSEGTEDAPIRVTLEQLPLAGQVATASASWYVVRGLSIGTQYTAQVATAQEVINIQAFTSLSMSFPLLDYQATPGSPGELAFTATHESLIFRVSQHEPSDWITDISIDLIPQD